MIERWTIAVCASLLLVGCGANNTKDTPNDETEQKRSVDAAASKETSMTEKVVRQSGNPAERQGVKVYRPKQLPNTAYDQSTRTLTNLDTRDKLIVSSPGHADGPGQFGFSNEKTGGIAGGSFKDWGDKGVYVYEITSILTTEDGFRKYRAREEYDIGRLAEMWRARYDQIDPDHGKQILIVDSRPEKINEINPQNGIRKAAQ
jgi:hypothetical protein